MNSGFEWQPYTSVAQKKNEAVRHAAEVATAQKRLPAPVILQGRQIAKTFWGKAWCDNLTSYQDYSSRLAQGAIYLRNGSVVDLVIKPKRIDAIIAGSEPYEVCIKISELDKKRWKSIRSDCSASIDSVLDLLSGKLSDETVTRLTDQKSGLFPAPREIQMSCTCPDYSSCCKHLAAVLYGIGARLDSKPELLFLLRGVNHQELVSKAVAARSLDREPAGVDSSLDSEDSATNVGIDLKPGTDGASTPKKKKRGTGNLQAAAAPSRIVKAVAAQKSTTAVKATKKTSAVKPVQKGQAVTTKASAAQLVNNPPQKAKSAAGKKPADVRSPTTKPGAKSRSKASGKKP